MVTIFGGCPTVPEPNDYQILADTTVLLFGKFSFGILQISFRVSDCPKMSWFNEIRGISSSMLSLTVIDSYILVQF